MSYIRTFLRSGTLQSFFIPASITLRRDNGFFLHNAEPAVNIVTSMAGNAASSDEVLAAAMQ